jgi:hypothetical protein
MLVNSQNSIFVLFFVFYINFMKLKIIISFLALFTIFISGCSTKENLLTDKITSCADVVKLSNVQLDKADEPICEPQSIYNEGGRKVYILHYTFSGLPMHDCESGCILMTAVKVYDPMEKKLYDFERFSPVMNYSHRLGGLPQDCGNTQKNNVSLFKEKGKFYWMVEFLPHDQQWKYGCEVDGFYVYTVQGLYKDQVSYKYYPIDCSNADQAKKYLEVSGRDSFGDVVDKCYYFVAIFQKKCDLCQYVKDEDYKSKCPNFCK